MTRATDEKVVRDYLRAVVGAPARVSDSLDVTEAPFVRVGARWAASARVCRSTLETIGVPRSVLDRAGVKQLTAADRVQALYSSKPFDAPTLARRARVPEATVRRIIRRDVEAGALVLAIGDTRPTLWCKRSR